MRTVTIATPLEDENFDVVHMSGAEALGAPFGYTVEVSCTNPEVDPNKLLGQGISVGFHLQDDTVRYVHGMVTSIHGGTRAANHAHYRLTLRPAVWMLSRASNCRIFQKMTVPEVIAKVLREHNITDFDDESLSQTYRTWEYLTQYRETDLNFITRLMEQEGIYYHFRHEEQRHVLVFADGMSSHQPVTGAEKVPYRAPGQQGHSLAIHTWAYTNNLTTGTVATTDFDFTEAKKDLMVSQEAGHQHMFGDLEMYDYPGEYEQAEDGKQYAKMALQALTAQQLQTTGQGDVTLFYAGGLFTLEDFPREDQNVEHLLTRVQFQLAGSDRKHRFSTTFDAIPTTKKDSSGNAQEHAFRLPRTTKKSIVAGPQTATVVGKAGEEIWTDKYGRVKLQFHWDRDGKSDESSSCWVRVSQQWAGSKWGSLHTPRIGQEVIVSFLEGDPDRPIVTGRVYNNDNLPPFSPEKTKTQSGIKSRSTKGGLEDNCNEIRFEDKKGEEEFFMQAEKNLNTVVKNNETRSVGADQTISVKANQKTTVDKNRTVEVEGSQRVFVNSKEQGDGQKVLGSELHIEGEQVTYALEGVTIESPRQILLKVGETTITITPDAITLSTKGGSKAELTEKIYAEANGKATFALDTYAAVQSADNSVLNLSEKIELTSNKEVIVAGQDITVDGQMGCLVQSGPSSKITVKPESIKKESGMIDVQSTGPLGILGSLIKIG